MPANYLDIERLVVCLVIHGILLFFLLVVWPSHAFRDRAERLWDRAGCVDAKEVRWNDKVGGVDERDARFAMS